MHWHVSRQTLAQECKCIQPAEAPENFHALPAILVKLEVIQSSEKLIVSLFGWPALTWTRRLRCVWRWAGRRRSWTAT